MIQQNLFEYKEKPKPKVTIFSLNELQEEPEDNPAESKNIFTETTKGMKETSWATPIMGLITHTLIVGAGVIAALFLIGCLLGIAGTLIGGIIDLAVKYPVVCVVLACLVGGLLLSMAKPTKKPILLPVAVKPMEVKPIEDNSGLFD